MRRTVCVLRRKIVRVITRGKVTTKVPSFKLTVILVHAEVPSGNVPIEFAQVCVILEID